MTTLRILEAVIERLKQKLPALAVEYFPINAETYRLNHPAGALLVGYAGSTYDGTQDTRIIAQARQLQITVTVVLRQLNGQGGAVDVLDKVRHSLVGVKLPFCRTPLAAMSDTFLGATAGTAQYAISFGAQSVLVQDDIVDDAPRLTQITWVESADEPNQPTQPTNPQRPPCASCTNNDSPIDIKES
ncbi:Gp37 family protein [Sapientia aquatica]|uniref:DUF1834 family protein n=1 Tax=Sapientia aquatica TaxID=1549640 RepID=A0A4V3AUT9_9BURK|nr:Gp37 family protein [Sapientia aquatica]TDK65980.1 hypothetical protein E2I14_10320 [Sapientia aquatica]